MGDDRPGTPAAVLARCADAGHTPGVKDVEMLVELWEGAGLDPAALRTRRKLVVKALGRSDLGVARRLLRGWTQASGDQRAMRLQVLARIGRRVEIPELPELLLAGLRDDTPRVVREAARALAKADQVDGALYEDALLAVSLQADLPERKAAVEALGRVGGPGCLAPLAGMPDADQELRRRINEAITLIERRQGRGQVSRIERSRAQPAECRVLLRCRARAAPIVADQARTLLPRERMHGAADDPVQVQDDAAVQLGWSGTLAELDRVRSAIDVALVFALSEGGEISDRIVATLQRAEVIEALTAWTEGTVRFRLAFAEGGRRRAAIRRVAQQLTQLGSPLINDSRNAPWRIEVDETRAQLACIPRGDDPRFAYRRADVPAASHPSLAALLAWAGRPEAGDRVWDPFCGSGSELIECAMLQPDLHVWGTDVDAAAIEAAEGNFAAADVGVASVRWQRTDARTAPLPPGFDRVSLIVSNPPMGRRLATEGGPRPLLTAFVKRAAQVLAPGGRLVWVSPLPKDTADAGRAQGLLVERLGTFDMGGFSVVVQQMRKPPTSR